MRKPRWWLLYAVLILFGLALVGVEQIPVGIVTHDFLYGGAALLFIIGLGLWIATNQTGLARESEGRQEPLWVVTYESAENEEKKRQEEERRRVAA